MLRKVFGGRDSRRYNDVLCEAKVTLAGCTLLGTVRVGYRSYANESLLRNVDVGRFCSIGRRCSIGGALHEVDCFTTHPTAASPDFLRDPQTRVGHDVWIGDNVVIVAGVTIGDGAVIGGGAVVTADVAPYAIVAGVPARLLRSRFDEETAAALRQSQWWRYGDAARDLAGSGARPKDMLKALARGAPPVLEPHFRAWDAA
jgi:hypothetical protein